MENSFVLRDATPEDAHALAELERECFSHPWSERAFLDSMAAGNIELLIYAENGAIVGYIGMQRTADAGFITNLCVAEECRRRGVGRHLMATMLGRAAALLQREVTLEVRSTNAAAIALYEAMGFRAVGRRARLYKDPEEDGIIMTVKVS